MIETLYGIWYADYSNSSAGDAVYSSRDDADAVARATDGDVICFELDPSLDAVAQKLRRPGERFYAVAMSRSGKESQAWAKYSAEESPDETVSVRVSKAGKVERFNASCWAADEKHAIKIVNDRRTQWIAAGEQFDSAPQPIGGHDYGWRRALP